MPKTRFNLGVGANSGKDPQDAPRLARVENAVYDKDGAITKRHGYTTASSSAVTGRQLVSDGNYPIVLGKTTELVQEAATDPTTTIDSEMDFADLSVSSVSSLASPRTQYETVVHMSTWILTVRGIDSTNYAVTIMTPNGHALSKLSFVTDGSKQIHAIKAGSYVWIIHVDASGNIAYRRYDIDGLDASGTVAPSADVATNSDGPRFAALEMSLPNKHIAVVYHHYNSGDASTQDHFRIMLEEADDASPLFVSQGFVDPGQVAIHRCGIWLQATTVIGFAYYYDNAADGQVAAFTFNIVGSTTVQAPIDVMNLGTYATGEDTSNNLGPLAGVGISSSDFKVLAFKQFADATVDHPYIVVGGITSSSAVTTTRLNRAQYISDPFRTDDYSRVYYPIAFNRTKSNNDVNSCLIVLDLNLNPIAHWRQYQLMYAPNRSTPSVVTDDTKWAFGFAYYLDAKDNLVGLDVYQGMFVFDTATRPMTSARYNNNVIIAGALPLEYDGYGLFESGFLVSPGTTHVTTTADSASGSLTDGTHFFRVTYEHVDNHGNLHISEPDFLDSFEANSSRRSYDVNFPSLQYTRRSGIKVVVYMTEAGASSPFYYVGEAANNLTSASGETTVTINMSDADLIKQRPLYTSGGILAHNPPGAMKSISTHQGRLVYVPVRINSNAVAYTKYIQPLYGIGFSNVLSVETPFSSGVTALFSYYDRLFCFTQNSLAVGEGDGYTNQGIGQNYSIPFTLSSTVGTSGGHLVAATDRGLLFRSSTSIYMTDGSRIMEAGRGVLQQLRTVSVKRAITIPNQDVVIFLTDGVSLVYNYRHQMWATWSNYASYDGCFVNGLLYRIQSGGTYDGYVVKESLDSYSDVDTAIVMRLDSGWIDFNSGRVQNVIVKGYNGGDNKIYMAFRYDHQSAFVQRVEFASGSLTNTTDNDFYNADPSAAVSSNTAPVYPIKLQPKRALCNAFAFSIYDEDLNGSMNGPPLVLTSLELEYTVNRGVARLGSARRGSPST